LADEDTHELVMRILKLRWIGMENEAEKNGDGAAPHRSRKHAGAQLGRYRLTQGSMAHAAFCLQCGGHTPRRKSF
jgi:hypothetical protein